MAAKALIRQKRGFRSSCVRPTGCLITIEGRIRFHLNRIIIIRHRSWSEIDNNGPLNLVTQLYFLGEELRKELF